MSWLIGLGRESFEKVADCPDLLIELPQVSRYLDFKREYSSSKRARSRDMRRRLEEEWPEFELPAYVAHEAYERITGSGSGALYEAVHGHGVFSGFPLIPALGGVPDGEQWDFDDPREFARRVPRTARHRQAGPPAFLAAAVALPVGRCGTEGGSDVGERGRP